MKWWTLNLGQWQYVILSPSSVHQVNRGKAFMKTKRLHSRIYHTSMSKFRHMF